MRNDRPQDGRKANDLAFRVTNARSHSGGSAHPDFSPAMLALFLRARAAERRMAEGCTRETAARRERAHLRRLAHLTVVQIDMAWMGRLWRAAPRAALWAVLGHFPSDHGIVLSDDGGQHG